MRLPLVLVVVVCLVSACQAPPGIQQLQDQNSALQQQLSSSNQQVELLQADKEVLQNDIAELKRVMGVLGEEKSSRCTSEGVASRMFQWTVNPFSVTSVGSSNLSSGSFTFGGHAVSTRLASALMRR